MSRDKEKMTSMPGGQSGKPDGQSGPKVQRPNGRHKDPEWASGLRRLYDSVVEEPLPDSFAELLDKLDARDNG